jgi:hypothetical protein
VKQSPQKRAKDRQESIQEHFKGKQKQIDEATASCDDIDRIMDAMDDSLDLWVDFIIADKKATDKEQKEHMADFGKLVEGLKEVVDEVTERVKWVARSRVECELAEDMYALGKIVFNFILGRMREYDKKDKELKANMKDLKEKLGLIHDRNLRTLKKFKVDEPEHTRPIETVADRIQRKFDEKKKKRKMKSKSASNVTDGSGDKKSEQSAASVAVTTVEQKKPTEAEKSASAGAQVAKQTKVEREQEREATSAPVQKDEPRRDVDKRTAISRSESRDTIDDESSDGMISISDVKSRHHLRWQLIRQLEQTVKTSHRYESAVKNAGLSLPEDHVTYDEAEQRIAEITRRMEELGYKNPEYFKLEQEMQKYTTALMSSDQYKNQLLRREQQWENDNKSKNMQAIQSIWRHMPVNVRHISEERLVTTATPNGKYLPKAIARKFKRTDVLQLLRVSPDVIEKMHFASLEALSLSGITLTELRAIYEHLRTTGSHWEKAKGDSQIERKYMWFVMIKDKLKQAVQKWDVHIDAHGPPHNHNGCTLKGNMCPIRADCVTDYSDDYGFPAKAEYEVIEITREDLSDLAAKSMREAQDAVRDRAAYWGQVAS